MLDAYSVQAITTVLKIFQVVVLRDPRKSIVCDALFHQLLGQSPLCACTWFLSTPDIFAWRPGQAAVSHGLSIYFKLKYLVLHVRARTYTTR